MRRKQKHVIAWEQVPARAAWSTISAGEGGGTPERRPLRPGHPHAPLLISASLQWTRAAGSREPSFETLSLPPCHSEQLSSSFLPTTWSTITLPDRRLLLTFKDACCLSTGPAWVVTPGVGHRGARQRTVPMKQIREKVFLNS